MVMREPLVVGNWKMNGSRTSIHALVNSILEKEIPGCHIMVCPSFVFLGMVHDLIGGRNLGLAAQNLDWHGEGAFTGEVSGVMLKDVGCTHTLVGHSERRELFGETDQTVARKFAAALEHGLRPIFCFGESLSERESGNTEAVVLRQVNAVLDVVDIDVLKHSVFAYEPVWAIGTGKSATAAQAEAVHGIIRARIARESEQLSENLQILYGGSVKPENADELFARENIDGALVGGASLNPDSFLAICSAAARSNG